MPRERESAIVDRAAWQNVTQVPAGIREESVVEKVWKDIEGTEGEITLKDLYSRHCVPYHCSSNSGSCVRCRI